LTPEPRQNIFYATTMRTLLLLVAGAALAGLAPARLHAQTAPPGLPQYVLLGLEGVTVRAGARVTAGAVGTLNGFVRLGRSARVTNAVAGPMVRLGRATRTGRLFCHFVTGPPLPPVCNAFTDPLVDPALLPPVTVEPGEADLGVPPRTGTSPVPAGSFRDVRIGAGGVLQLAGGSYSMRSLRIAPRARLVCNSACRIGVRELVRLRRGAELGAAVRASANTVRIDIAATELSRPAFVARARATLSATVFAPDGDVVLGPRGDYRGAVIGRTIRVGPGATLRGDSAL
jgi:hypothetical protein